MASGTGGAELVDSLARHIREGVYHPHERLIESELCERYGTSRTAVRSALIELTALGLVEREANRGARVRHVPIDEAIETAEVRFTLQAMCDARAATRATDADREELAVLRRRLTDAVAAADRRQTAALNDEISRVVRRISGHAIASRIIEGLQSQIPVDRYPHQLPDRRMASMAEFEEIIEAILVGDEGAALAAGHRHRDNILAALRQARDAAE